MAAVVKLRKIGNSLGVLLPKDELERLHLKDGDELTLISTERGLEITPYDPDFDKKMRAFERTRRKYRNAFRELAK